MKALFGGAYNGVRVLITGHSGFKGSWLTYWLERMGAKVAGYGLEPPTDPNHASLLQLDVETVVGDIRDGTALQRLFTTFEPEIVFHLPRRQPSEPPMKSRLRLLKSMFSAP